MNTSDTLSHRQFIWGLSNGILVLAVAGAFWLGIAAVPVLPWAAAPIAGIAAALVAGGFRLRREARGFRLAELKNAGEAERERFRKIRVGYRWTVIAQTLLTWAAVGVAMQYHREDLIWPAIGLVVSLHFLPLGYLFHVRPYYLTTAAGCAACVAAMLSAAPQTIAGLGMGLTVWATGWYALLRAEHLAAIWDDAL